MLIPGSPRVPGAMTVKVTGELKDGSRQSTGPLSTCSPWRLFFNSGNGRLMWKAKGQKAQHPSPEQACSLLPRSERWAQPACVWALRHALWELCCPVLPLMRLPLGLNRD